MSYLGGFSPSLSAGNVIVLPDPRYSPGGTLAAQINSALAALPGSAGTVDASRVGGAQTIDATVAIAQGQTVLLPPGVLTCATGSSSAFTLSQWATLLGSNWGNSGTQLFPNAGMTVPVISVKYGAPTWCHGFRIEHLDIIGSNNSSSTCHGIQVYWMGEGTQINRVRVNSMTGWGMWFDGNTAGAGMVSNITLSLNVLGAVNLNNWNNRMSFYNVSGDKNGGADGAPFFRINSVTNSQGVEAVLGITGLKCEAQNSGSPVYHRPLFLFDTCAAVPTTVFVRDADVTYVNAGSAVGDVFRIMANCSWGPMIGIENFACDINSVQYMLNDLQGSRTVTVPAVCDLNAGATGMQTRVRPWWSYSILAVPSFPSVTASPYTWTNATGSDAFLSVAGGTVSQIAIMQSGSPYVTGATSGVFPVRNQNGIKITYSVAPTVTLIPLL